MKTAALLNMQSLVKFLTENVGLYVVITGDMSLLALSRALSITPFVASYFVLPFMACAALGFPLTTIVNSLPFLLTRITCSDTCLGVAI